MNYKQDNEKRNYIIYCLSKVFENIARVFSVGTVIQTFMLEYGVSESNTALYSAIVQIANAIIIFCMIFVARYIKREKFALTLVSLAGTIAPITLLFFAICTNISVTVAFWIIAFASLIINLGLGVQQVLSYTFPYKIINMENYGKFAGLTGVISYPACLISIFLMTFFTKKFDYFTVMAIFFSVAIIAWLASAFLIFRIKENDKVSVVFENSETPKNESFNVFKYKPTYWLMLPNLLRGFAVGIIGQFVVFGYHDGILDSTSANWVSFLYYAGIMVSNVLYTALFKKRNTPLMLIILGGVPAVIMPLVVSTGNVYVFLVLYFLLYAVLGIFDTMLPVTLTKMFPYEGMGTFTSIRMFLMSVGTAIPGLIFDWLYSIFNTVTILILGGVCLLACAFIYAGVMFYLDFKQKKSRQSVELKDEGTKC